MFPRLVRYKKFEKKYITGYKIQNHKRLVTTTSPKGKTTANI